MIDMLNIVDKLKEYVEHNEVVYQTFGGLMDVANENEEENKHALLAQFEAAWSVEIYSKGDQFIADDFCELNSWATEDDALFLLQAIGTLICIPKKLAVENGLIAA